MAHHGQDLESNQGVKASIRASKVHASHGKFHQALLQQRAAQQLGSDHHHFAAARYGLSDTSRALTRISVGDG